jgi:hypothetical protein
MRPRTKTTMFLAIGVWGLWLQVTSTWAQTPSPQTSDRYQFGAVAEEKREELELAECDRKADSRISGRSDRLAFIQRCLEEQEAQMKPHR